MGSELIHLLEEEARVEKDKVLAEARAKADAILTAAHPEAEEIVAEGRRRTEDERAQSRARATSTASLRAAALVLAAKDAAIRKVFEQAETELRSASQDPHRRRAMIHALLREATRGLPGGRVTIEASPGDVQMVQEACRELGVDGEARENVEVTDGVRLASPDGRVVVENTMPSRLVRARREMVSRVAEILWGVSPGGRPNR